MRVTLETGQVLYGLRDLPSKRADHDAFPEVSCVYLFIRDGRPLYVGQTVNLASRIRAHRRRGGKLHLRECTTIRVAWQVENDPVERLAIETMYVAAWRPQDNRAIMLRVHGQKLSEIRFGSKARSKGKGKGKAKRVSRWAPQ